MTAIPVVRAVVQYVEQPDFVLIDALPPATHKRLLGMMGQDAIDISDDSISFPYNRAPTALQFLQTLGVGVKITRHAHAVTAVEDPGWTRRNSYEDERTSVAPVTRKLPAGVTLYHGTDATSKFEFPRGPAWFTESLKVAKEFGDREEGGYRIMAYEVKRPLNVMAFPVYQDVFDFLNSKFGMDIDYTYDAAKVFVENFGSKFDGWVLYDAYPGGFIEQDLDGPVFSDVMVIDPAKSLKFLGEYHPQAEDTLAAVTNHSGICHAHADTPKSSKAVSSELDWAYHVTLREFLPSIAKNGLQPKPHQHTHGEAVIFVEDDEDEAAIYHEPPRTVMLRFKTDGFPTTDDGEYVHYGEVKPEALEIRTKGGFTPLLPYIERQAVKKITSSEHKGVMIALYPPKEVAEKFAVEGGESADNMHITLAYLGKLDELPDGAYDLAVKACEKVAAEQSKLSGEVGGIGRWAAGDDQDVIYASVDVPGSNELQTKIVAALEEAGIQARHNHGWSAHMTLQYLEPGLDIKVHHVDPVEVSFDSVWVVSGDKDRKEIKFGGPEKVEAWNVLQRRGLDRQRFQRDVMDALENARTGHLGDDRALPILLRTGLDPRKPKEAEKLRLAYANSLDSLDILPQRPIDFSVDFSTVSLYGVPTTILNNGAPNGDHHPQDPPVPHRPGEPPRGGAGGNHASGDRGGREGGAPAQRGAHAALQAGNHDRAVGPLLGLPAGSVQRRTGSSGRDAWSRQGTLHRDPGLQGPVEAANPDYREAPWFKEQQQRMQDVSTPEQVVDTPPPEPITDQERVKRDALKRFKASIAVHPGDWPLALTGRARRSLADLTTVQEYRDIIWTLAMITRSRLELIRPQQMRGQGKKATADLMWEAHAAIIYRVFYGIVDKQIWVYDVMNKADAEKQYDKLAKIKATQMVVEPFSLSAEGSTADRLEMLASALEDPEEHPEIMDAIATRTVDPQLIRRVSQMLRGNE